jgi:hypothetical protein
MLREVSEEGDQSRCENSRLQVPSFQVFLHDLLEAM